MKRIFSFATLAVSFAAFAETVYENDFTVRRSAGAIPSGEWREISYVPGPLVNAIYFDGVDFQDNWIMGQNSCGGRAAVVDDDGNQMVVAHYDSSPATQHAILKHRLGNIFTSGVVTVQCDIKPPASWGYYSIQSLRVVLGDEIFFSPDIASSDYQKYIAAGAGVSKTTEGYSFFGYGAGTGGAAESGVWYRLVIAADLDNAKWNASFHKLGSEHPAFNTPAPESPVHVIEDIPFRHLGQNVPLSGISSVGLMGYGVSGTTNAADRAKTAQFDNLRVWHNGVACYENDFTTRRSRSLAGGKTSSVYAVSMPVTNTVRYASGTMLVAPADKSVATGQPIGVDGWRRMNKETQAGLTTVAFQDSIVGRISDSSAAFSWAAHPLGRRFTSGKVRFCADVRITDFLDTASLRIVLGSDVFYGGSDNSFQTGRIADFGLSGKTFVSGGTTLRKIFYYTYNTDTTKAAEMETGDGVNKEQWLRLCLEADIDNATYDCAIFAQSDKNTHPAYGAADGAELFRKTGIPWANPKRVGHDAVTCLALASYWANDSYFDNLSVWHSPSGSEVETLVYSNTFSERKVYLQDCCEDRLVGTIKKNPEGMDGWMRLGRADADVMLVDDGANAAIAFADNNTENASWAVHDLGESFESGKMTATFDILAPSMWAKDSGRAAVWIGGGQFREGNLSGGEYGFEKWAVCGAGFSNTTFAAWSGDGSGGGSWAVAGTVTPGHWYRFVVTASLGMGEDTSDVAVYDLGTAAPTPASVCPPSPVATFTALPFRRSVAAAVSCIAVEAAGISNGNLLKGDARFLLDNLRVNCKPHGFWMIFR